MTWQPYLCLVPAVCAVVVFGLIGALVAGVVPNRWERSVTWIVAALACALVLGLLLLGGLGALQMIAERGGRA